MRAGAWTVLAAGVAAPVVRRRLRLPAPVVIGAAASAPFALCVAVRRSKARDVAVCALQMWAYVAAYKMPNDDPQALERRVHVDYPVAIDGIIGLGKPPTLRLQRWFTADRWTASDKLLVWAHWIWFLVPHSALVYVLLRRYDQFPRAAVMTYAVFDLGSMVYWILPTAPPWYAAEHGRLKDQTPLVRRMMVEYGQDFWKHRWGPMYGLFGGNPLAAMPSLHFGTSVMAARVLADTGPIAGTVGWTYALTLGVALVYLGEHYVIDLIAGAALAEVVRRQGPRATPLLRRIARTVKALERRAHADQ
jgi:membrane-associated phospholipid phosphatase